MENDAPATAHGSLLALLAELEPIDEEFPPIQDLPAEDIDDILLPGDEDRDEVR
jgi:hypothetical protein